MDDHQAITKLKAGDIHGLEELVNGYYLQAVRAAYLIVQDHDLAEDIVQTSFVNLDQKINQFDETRDFRPWFMRMIVNKTISACRSQKKNISLTDLDESGWDNSNFNLVFIPGNSIEDEYITRETCQTIWFALEQLNPLQKAAIVMRYYLDFSENEISEALNRSKSTVKWVLFSARRKLNKILIPFNAEIKQQNAIVINEEKL
jgi:RNA polymerase sigma factor (sigma-70 family)